MRDLETGALGARRGLWLQDPTRLVRQFRTGVGSSWIVRPHLLSIFRGVVQPTDRAEVTLKQKIFVASCGRGVD